MRGVSWKEVASSQKEGVGILYIYVILANGRWLMRRAE